MFPDPAFSLQDMRFQLALPVSCAPAKGGQGISTGEKNKVATKIIDLHGAGHQQWTVRRFCFSVFQYHKESYESIVGHSFPSIQLLSQFLEHLPTAESLPSSLRPQAPRWAHVTVLLSSPSISSSPSSLLLLGASCKNEYFKIHPPGGPLQVKKHHPLGNLTPSQG